MATVNEIKKVITCFKHVPGRSLALKPKTLEVCVEDFSKLKLSPKQCVDTFQLRSAAESTLKNTTKELSAVRKPMSETDILNLRAYGLQRYLDLNISAKELRTLYTFEGQEYQLKAFELLTKKLKVPKELMPKLVHTDNMFVDQAVMEYLCLENTIQVNKMVSQLQDKTYFIILLRHELQYWIQNMKMLSHETRGIEYIEKLSQAEAKRWTANLDYYVKNLNLEQLRQTLGEDFMAECTELKKLLQNNKLTEYQEHLEEIEKYFKDGFVAQCMELRNTIIAKRGVVKVGTREGKRAEKMINETLSEQGYIENEKINLAKYFGDCRENEALEAQNALYYRVTAMLGQKSCHLNNVKNILEDMKKDIETLSLEEQEEFFNDLTKGASFKEFVSYIYD